MANLPEVYQRIRAYCDAVPTLYDEQDPMHPELVLDSATNWTDMPKTTTHNLIYTDLLGLLDALDPTDLTVIPCEIADTPHEPHPIRRLAGITVAQCEGKVADG